MAATAAVVTAAAAVGSLAYGVSSGNKAAKRADDAAELERQQAEQNAKAEILSTKQQASDLSTNIAQTEVDIAEAQSKISGLEGFLGRWEDYYNTETTKASAEIAGLESSGKSNFENLMQTFGYAEALAGATGRTAPGTSMAAVVGKTRQDVVDYTGEDMTLDANGGLFGKQLSSANMSYDQLLLDLSAERGEAQANLDIYSTSLSTLQQSKATMTETLTQTNQRVTEMQAWIDEQFGTKKAETPTYSRPISLGKIL